MLKNQAGFAHLFIILPIVAAVLTGGFLYVRSHQHQTVKKGTPVLNQAQSPQAAAQPKNQVSWYMSDGGVWAHTGTPPACPAQPILATPVDMSLVSSILYPGQVRGNAFKPQGG